MTFSFKKEVRDINRLRQIATVLFEEGFGYLVGKIRLKVPLSKRIKQGLIKKEKTAPAIRLRLTLERLGPTFIKFGQVLSVRPDLMPKSYIKELESLQDKVPPFPYAAAEQQVKKELAYVNELVDWLSGNFISMIQFTERNIMIRLREEFSEIFNKWFSVLVSETLRARLDEDFTPVIEQQGFEIDYAYLSGGERTAVALAYRLALNQVINSLLSRIKTKDIVILDEPTDGFSEQQLDKMRDVLQQLKVRQLILVSHEAKIESFVEKIIKFRKEDGVTKVEG